MLSNGVDLVDRSSAMDESPVSSDKIIERNCVVQWFLCHSGATAANQKNRQRRSLQVAQRLQYGLSGPHRLGVRHRMSALEIAESPRLPRRLHRTGHDALETAAGALLQSFHQAMGGF